MKLEVRMYSGNSEMTITNGEGDMRVQNLSDFFPFEKETEYKVTIEKL